MSESRGASVVGWGVVLVAIAVLGYLWFAPANEPDPDKDPSADRPSQELREYLANAEQLLEEGRFAEARKVAKTAIALKDSGNQPLLIAGEASAQLDEIEEALDFYNKVPRDKSASSISAGVGIATVQYFKGSFAKAEEALRDVLERRPGHAAANDRMAELLDVEGRRWESIPYAIETLRQGKGTLETLVLLSDQNYIIRYPDRAQGALDRDPTDVGPLFGLARMALDNGEQASGLEMVQKVLAKRPDLLDAQVVWGEHLLNDQPAKFPKWEESLPESAEEHPGVWKLRGLWARRSKQLEPAARCFWETLRRNPNDLTAHLQLGQVLKSLELFDAAKKYLDRGASLSDLRRTLEPVFSAGSDATPDELMDVAIAMESVGRELEAQNWEREANSVAGTPFRFKASGTPAKSRRQAIRQWVSPDSQPALFADLSHYPLPKISADGIGEETTTKSQFKARFEDLAADVGLTFTYIPAPDEATEGKRVIELTGGGAAAIDYDLDCRPDVFFTQGGKFPRQQAPEQPTDKLFRQVGEAFVDVTAYSGLGSPEYGQGMAVGDFNSDGFPDLAIGNLGPNQLFVNNGDGTFSEVSSVLNDESKDWSTSLVFADLDGDALPDLYVANYLAGERIADLICRLNEESLPRICTPDQFESAQDRIYLNWGDGGFADRTEESGVVIGNGKGLGVLAADFTEAGNLQLFVANDGVPNFFFQPKPDAFEFEENAQLVGVAISGEGKAQACMGIAAGDANADGRLDFFVTNFDRESNTLYVGSDGFFEDSSRPARIREPSYRLLGFGTQFVDGELDGELDLLLTNGHVDDFSHQGTAYRMRAQYMQNVGGGIFAERMADSVGSFFDKEQLGRGMCRLDWNRDGRADVVISHLDTPAALLTNVSEATGHYLSIKLVGTNVSRDAVGTVVVVTDGEWQRMQQRVAGDGYLCSNEPLLSFGLGERTRVPKLEVQWPDGSSQQFDDLAADHEYVIVQGRNAVFQSVE